MDYGYFPLFKKQEREGNVVRELSVFCQSHFNKTLIGQAGSIGGKTRQEVAWNTTPTFPKKWTMDIFFCLKKRGVNGAG